MKNSDRPAPSARYAVHTGKVVEAILWLARAKPGIDLHHVVKCAYFADKEHWNRHGRTIAGDDYDAAAYGPLGRSAYGLLRGDPIEMIALGGNGRLPFRVNDAAGWTVQADREANLAVLSRSDVAALQHALDHAGHRGFEDLVEETHADPAYMAARGGRISFEDMIDEDVPDREAKRADLAEVARSAVF